MREFCIDEGRVPLLADFPNIFPSPRAENWREHVIELWRTGYNIGFVRTGANSYGIAYLGDTEVPSVEEIQRRTKESRKAYPYTLFFLDEISHNPAGITEKDIARRLFAIRRNGEVDQVHPTMDDLTRWGLIERGTQRRLSAEGRTVLDAHREDPLVFLDFKVDLNNDRASSRLLWALLKEVQNDSDGVPAYPYLRRSPPYTASAADVLELYNGTGRGSIPYISDGQAIARLLGAQGIDHLYDPASGTITVMDRVFYSITPQGYIQCGLAHMDDIDAYRIRD